MMMKNSKIRQSSIRNKSVNKLVVRNYDSSFGVYTPREAPIFSCALSHCCTLVDPLLTAQNIYRSAISNCANANNLSVR
jgi:hypothetical protein